jgi:hypothetical protein
MMNDEWAGARTDHSSFIIHRLSFMVAKIAGQGDF